MNGNEMKHVEKTPFCSCDTFWHNKKYNVTRVVCILTRARANEMVSLDTGRPGRNKMCNGKEHDELISIIRRRNRGQDRGRVVRHVADARQPASGGAFRLITL